ncbi:ubinuclein-1 isoform X2 [Electrophorus electricus]|uniref:ubinuclein-1 isoform X2 n=1 Tax=Electrophorus electricus TaxID=8005 RepID=UPI0015D06CE1|nr:ubinuclein-1 isoform X2 [Electrophorus electricus]
MCAMAAPRRIQLTTLSNEATLLHTICTSHVHEEFPKQDVVAAELPRTETSASDRIELVLFESDERRCPEFYYPELIKVKVTAETRLNALDEAVTDKERDELEYLARKFEEKYGEPPTRRKDRWQDLVDMGYGYDETDSFIDNSEAYDELVPASLSTKYGGFYINSGILHFRQAFEEGEENEMDDFENNIKFKKRKLKEGEGRTNKKRKEDLQPENENSKKSTLPGMSPEEKKKKKKSTKPQSIDGMLRKFHKEKLQQLQMFNVKGSDGLPTPADWAFAIPEEAPEDPLLTLIGSASADELLQAVKAVDQDFDLDGLLTEEHSTAPPDLEENRETRVVFQPTKASVSLPEGLPPMLLLCIQELCQVTKEIEGEKKLEALAPEINNVLLHVEVKSKEFPDKVRSRIFSYLASQLSCKKTTLLKRAKKLHLLHLDDQLRDLLLRLEGAVARTMPEQIDRFNGNCQAHSEARAAKLEAEKEQRAIDGSDEEDDDKSGKRIFGPRKRFRWTEEIRELLGEVVRLKMSSYELEAITGPSLEEYLRTFLEAEVKPLWPKGWMQSRILLIESRRVHGHITGVVARKKSMIPKSKKVGFSSEKTGVVQAVSAMKGPLGGATAQRKRLSLPLIVQQAPQHAICKPPCAQTVYFSPPLPKLRGEGGRSSLGGHQVSIEGEKLDVEEELEGTGKNAANPQAVSIAESLLASPGERLATDSGVGSASKTASNCGGASAPSQLPMGEKTSQKLTLVSPPAAAEGDTTAVQGVARLLTTTSFCKAPVSVTVAAVEGSCGDAALPTPSLSLQAPSYPNAPQSGALTNVVPLHALPFPGLAYAGKPCHNHTCKDMLSGPANGTFQYGLTHVSCILSLVLSPPHLLFMLCLLGPIL